MKFNKVLLSLLLAVSVSSVGCSSRAIVEPGHELVVVDLNGADKGLENAEVYGSGAHWISWFGKRSYDYNVLQRHYVYTARTDEGSTTNERIDFNADGGVQVGADVGVSFQITDSKKLAGFYNREDELIIRGPLRTSIRNVFNTEGPKYTPQQLVGTKKANLFKDVTEALNAEFEPKGLRIISVKIEGRPAFPDNIQASFDARYKAIAATEEAKAKVAQAKADLEVSRIQAEKRKFDTQSITELQLRREAIKKWDGKLPNNTAGAIPFIGPAAK